MSGRAWQRVLVVGVATVAMASCLIVYLGWRWVTPPRWAQVAPSEGEEIWFDSLDGVRLRGRWLAGHADFPSILVCHGHSRNLAEPYDVGRRLRAAGYNVFLFDFRASGQSEGKFSTVGAKETLDVMAAVAEVKKRGRLPIGVLGISMGGAASVLAAARTQDIRALVLDSVFADLGQVMEDEIARRVPMSAARPFARLVIRVGEWFAGASISSVRPIDSIAKLSPRPVFFIYGEEDTHVSRSQRRALIDRAGSPKEIWIVSGSQHAVVHHDHPDDYEKRVEDFFARHLRSVR